MTAERTHKVSKLHDIFTSCLTLFHAILNLSLDVEFTVMHANRLVRIDKIDVLTTEGDTIAWYREVTCTVRSCVRSRFD